jgi:5'-nucleotidase
MARTLKHEQKCDLVICLSHIGYEYKNEPDKISDVKLAAATQDIDAIIGGHTHTFLDKPSVLRNANGKSVLVNQTGCYGLNLGRIDFYFENDAKASGRSIAI